jgi:hypothetical protein
MTDIRSLFVFPIILVPYLSGTLQNLPALDEADDHENHRDDEQDMNQAAERVGRDKADSPEDKQNYSDGIKHEIQISWLIRA